MMKEEMLLKVMSMLKDNQVEFIMDLSENKNNSLYQAIVDVLEYCSPFVQKLFMIGENIRGCIQDPTGYPYLIPQTVEKSS